MRTILSKVLTRILQSYQVNQMFVNHTVHNPHLAAKFYPYKPQLRSYLVRVATPEQRDDMGLPIPPPGDSATPRRDRRVPFLGQGANR